MLPVVLIIVAAAVLLFALEFWYIGHNEPTISARLQSANARMGSQVLAGIFFLLGALAGWFVAHFASVPPQ